MPGGPYYNTPRTKDTYAKLREYYDDLNFRQWRGDPRTIKSPIQYTAKSIAVGGEAPLHTDDWPASALYSIKTQTPVASRNARNQHARDTLILGGLNLLQTFRGSVPKLAQSAFYLTAPIIGSTTAGRVLKTAMAGIRTLGFLGLKSRRLMNMYPDIPTGQNPLRRVASTFARVDPSVSKVIHKRYGLQYENDTSMETDFEDMIKVKIGDTQVRGYIAGMTDGISPTWNETTYVGKPDPLVAYGGFTREISFELTLAALNSSQLRAMYRKLNRIASYTLPRFDPATGASTRYAGRLCHLTIGNYVVEQLCAMTALSITPNEDAPWEIGNPDLEYPSLTLLEGNPIAKAANAGKKAIKKLKKNKPNQSEKTLTRKQRIEKLKTTQNKFVMPRILTIGLTFKMLHNDIIGTVGAPLFVTDPYHAPPPNAALFNRIEEEKRQEAAKQVREAAEDIELDLDFDDSLDFDDVEEFI